MAKGIESSKTAVLYRSNTEKNPQKKRLFSANAFNQRDPRWCDFNFFVGGFGEDFWFYSKGEK